MCIILIIKVSGLLVDLALVLKSNCSNKKGKSINFVTMFVKIYNGGDFFFYFMIFY